MYISPGRAINCSGPDIKKGREEEGEERWRERGGGDWRRKRSEEIKNDRAESQDIGCFSKS